METLQAACNMLAGVFKELCMHILPIRYNTQYLNSFATYLDTKFNKTFQFKTPFHLYSQHFDASGLNFVSLAC